MGEHPETPSDVERAAAALRRGELVAIPTETVYGLGADAENPAAVRRIFAAKGRPADHPLIVHIADAAQLDRFARDVPDGARRLAARFWPGPLTIILLRRSNVPDEVTGGLDTVGLRVPDHPLALALLAAFGGGVAAPSANRFGRISPTTAEHVRSELGNRVAEVLDGGPCRVGVESTIVSLAATRPVLLRPGAIRAAQIAEVLGEDVLEAAEVDDAPRAPGTLASHYAPSVPLELWAKEALAARASELLAGGARVAVLTRGEAPEALGSRAVHHAAPADPDGFAHELYAALRALDATGVDRILVEEVPRDDAWRAVADRLARAAHPPNGEDAP